MSKTRNKVFEPLQLLWSRSPKKDYWRELEKTQYFPLQQLKEIQWKRLKSLWKFLWYKNDYYRSRFRQYGLTIESLQSLEDIAKLPIIRKSDIRQNVKNMISDGYHQDRLLHFKTGGSTGKALDIFITEECSELRNACARRHDRWTGWEPGETIGAVWGNPKIPTKLKDKLVDRLVQPLIYLDTMAVTDESVKKFAIEWKKKQPTLLFGHAHSLFILSKYVNKLGIDIMHPKGIISTSMTLLSSERSFIEKTFKTKVTDRYGCEEVSLIGSECEKHEGMHMNIEHLVIEVIKNDGTIAQPGELGCVVVTDLMNRSMPFVRYQVEDMATILKKQCSCGRKLPLMDKVAGRIADFLVKQDGTKVAGISLIENTLTKFHGLDQMQIIQKKVDEITLNIVPGIGYADSIGDELIIYFKKLFGQEVEVSLVLEKEIKPEKSGKYRFSICQIMKQL